MKNNFNYFNNEERNGIFLLSCLIVIFSIFIFFQKRVLPSHSTVNISLNDVYVEGDSDKANDAEDNKIQETKSYRSSGVELVSTFEAPLPSPAVSKVKRSSSEMTALDKLEPYPVENKSRQEKSVFKSSRKFVKKKQDQWKKQWKPKPVEAFSLNSENPEDWKQINGIGEGYSARIIKYKKWLGGFHSVDQLTEVYGLTDSLVQVMTPHLIVSKNIQKIKINYADSQVLGRHPYVEWKEADIIVKYRKHHFPITRESFSVLKGISAQTKRRIIPYLDFDTEDNLDQEDKKTIETESISL